MQSVIMVWVAAQLLVVATDVVELGVDLVLAVGEEAEDGSR